MVQKKREELSRVNKSLVKQPSIGGSSSSEDEGEIEENTLERDQRRSVLTLGTLEAPKDSAYSSVSVL